MTGALLHTLSPIFNKQAAATAGNLFKANARQIGIRAAQGAGIGFGVGAAHAAAMGGMRQDFSMGNVLQGGLRGGMLGGMGGAVYGMRGTGMKTMGMGMGREAYGRGRGHFGNFQARRASGMPLRDAFRSTTRR